MSPEKTSDVKELVSALQRYIDSLNDTLIKEVCKEIREANKQYRDLVVVVGDINVKLAKR